MYALRGSQRSGPVGRSEERRIVRTMVTAVTVAALLLVAAGCGGDSTSSAGDTTATESTDTSASTDTGTDTSGGTDTGSSTGTTDDGDPSIEGCEELTDLSLKFSQAMGAAASGGATDLEATAKAYEEFADDVPEEIRDAFQTVAAAFVTYADALEGIDLSSGETPDPDTLAKLAEAAKDLDNTELTAASAEIEAWARENCTPGG